MNKYTKKERVKIIKKILSDREIKSQLELLGFLKKRGFPVTQATIARDLEEIGVIKVRKGGRVFYQLPKEENEGLERKLRVSFQNFVVGLNYTDNLLLLKTIPGNASGIASVIDKLELNGITGTVAGDDTVLIVTAKKKTDKVLNFLKELMK